MSYLHDAYKQLDFLRQCLSNDKRPIGIFLGAGCPMAVATADGQDKPLIPDIDGMTKAVRDAISQDSQCSPFLKKIDEQFKQDGQINVNVEHILNRVRDLRRVAGSEPVRGLSATDLDKLDEKICQAIHDLVNKALPSTDTPYHCVASWIDAIRRENPVEIFTTNYDLLMEQAFEDCRVPYFDGFAGSRRPFFDIRAMDEDKLPPRWARLWKLHGSINWYQATNKGVFRGATSEVGQKRVIHPSHLKYEESRRMPYLAMMDRLRAFFRQPMATLIICGYSFRDDHINEVIVQGLQATHTAVAFALLFDKLANYRQATELAAERSNLTLLARDAAVIGGRESGWLEKEAASVPQVSGRWVKWTGNDQDPEDSKLKAEFLLGDFDCFGQFLHELIGVTREAKEAPNAQ